MENEVWVEHLPRGIFLGPNVVSTGREWGWKAIGYVGNLADGWHGPYNTKREAKAAAYPVREEEE